MNGPSNQFWNAADVVEDITRAARQLELDDYRERLGWRSAMYDGQFCGYESAVDKKLKEVFDSPNGKKLAKAHWPKKPWVHKIINMLSQVYQNVKDREVTADSGAEEDSNVELAADLFDDMNWIAWFRTFERQSNLLGSGIISITGNTWTGLPELKFHSLADVWVRVHPSHPNTLDACLGVAIKLPPVDEDQYSIQTTENCMFWRFLPAESNGVRVGWRFDLTDATGKVYGTFAGDSLTGGDNLPYLPMLPLVKTDTEHSETFYPDRNQNFFDEVINQELKEAELASSVFFGAHPMLFGRSLNAKNLAIGPDKLVETDNPEASLEYIQPVGINWQYISGLNDTDRKAFLASVNIPPTSTDAAGGNATGKAIFAANMPLYVASADQMPIWGDIERLTWKKLGAFCNWWFSDLGIEPQDVTIEKPDWGNVDWTQYSITINFPPPQPMMTEDEIDLMWKVRLNENRTHSIIDYLEEVKGLPREDAEKKAGEIAQGAKNAATVGRLNAINGLTGRGQ